MLYLIFFQTHYVFGIFIVKMLIPMIHIYQLFILTVHDTAHVNVVCREP